MSRTKQKIQDFNNIKLNKGYLNYEIAFEMMCEFAEKLEDELQKERNSHLETKGMNNTEFATNINNCNRCGENHTNLLFKKFTNDCSGFTYFAICPTNQEPVLLKIVEDNKEK